MTDWSDYQERIFEFAENGDGNAVIEAVAGSGKTTTLLEAMRVQPAHNTAFMAFNKSIADELQARVPMGLYVSTLHSYGLRAIRKAVGSVEIKANMIVDYLYKIIHSKELQKYIFDIADAISYLKFSLVVEPEASDMLKALMNQGLPPVKASLLVEPMSMAWHATLGMDIVDFDDMIYYPVVNSLPVRKFEMVFIDECQDLNPAQIVLTLMASAGRTICAGDRSQSIYAFRGADTTAMDKLSNALQAVALPLSITYRCSKAVVASVKDHVPYIEYAPGAVDGIVTQEKEETAVERLRPGDMVLCRTNAPLIEFAFKCLGASKPIRLNSKKSLGQGLKSVIREARKQGVESIAGFGKYASDYCFERIEQFRKDGQINKAIAWEDKLQVFEILCRNSDDLLHMLGIVDHLFDQTYGTLLTTVHGAKGLEVKSADNTAYILRPDLMPHPKAETDVDKVQEKNIQYVAYTRAKTRLVLLNPE